MTKHSPQQTFSLLAIVLAILLAVPLVLITNWNFYWIWLISLSVITFFLYGYDKGQAKLGGPRVPEIVLHGLALLGGFLGAWLARVVFSHKTRKTSFTIVLIVSTVVHLAIIYWVFIR